MNKAVAISADMCCNNNAVCIQTLRSVFHCTALHCTALHCAHGVHAVLFKLRCTVLCTLGVFERGPLCRTGAQGCDFWKGKRVLELGAGVAAPSIIAAQCGAFVTATDAAQRALVLAAANAGLNGVSAEHLRLQTLDWNSKEDFAAVLQHLQQQQQQQRRQSSGDHGIAAKFDVVIGASLLGWVVEEASVWKTLASLIDPHSSHGHVVFGHTSNQIVVPHDAGFDEVERQSGDLYGMGGARRSDFEVVVLQLARDTRTHNANAEDQAAKSEHTDEL